MQRTRILCLIGSLLAISQAAAAEPAVKVPAPVEVKRKAAPPPAATPPPARCAEDRRARRQGQREKSRRQEGKEAEGSGARSVRQDADRGRARAARPRLVLEGLPCRRRAPRRYRPRLAGDAAVAQSRLGPPQADRSVEALRHGNAKGRLDRPARRRHLAAARRPHADRTCEPPGRARRRHLADADAEPRIDAPGARGNSGDVDARQDEPRGRSQGLHAGARRDHQARRLLSAGRARIRQSGDQEGAVPGRRQGPRLARQGAPDLGAQLSLPHPHRLSQRRLPGAASGQGRRRLRQGGRQLAEDDRGH